jgi:hypothetical protein
MTCLNCGRERRYSSESWIDANVSQVLRQTGIKGEFCSFVCLNDYLTDMKEPPKVRRGK